MKIRTGTIVSVDDTPFRITAAELISKRGPMSSAQKHEPHRLSAMCLATLVP